jgi:hypothetical protein
VTGAYLGNLGLQHDFPGKTAHSMTLRKCLAVRIVNYPKRNERGPLQSRDEVASTGVS